jgi:hypothetical protein
MAQATGLSRMTISRIWHAFGLQAHRSATFKLLPDPLLIEKVRDIASVPFTSSSAQDSWAPGRRASTPPSTKLGPPQSSLLQQLGERWVVHKSAEQCLHRGNEEIGRPSAVALTFGPLEVAVFVRHA